VDALPVATNSADADRFHDTRPMGNSNGADAVTTSGTPRNSPNLSLTPPTGR